MTSSATMSDCEFLDFSLCDPSPLDMALFADEELSIGQFLEPLPSASEPDWFPVSESAGNTSNNYSSLGLGVLEGQRATTPEPLDSTVWVHELTGSTGCFAPLESEFVPDVPKPFDGEIPVQGTYLADVKRYMQRFGKVPNVNIFAPDEDDLDAIMYSSSDDAYSDDPVEIPSTPVRRRVVPLPKRRKRLVSRSSSVTASDGSDYASSPRWSRTSAHKKANSIYSTRIKASKAAIALHEPKDEPPAKKAKGRKTFNSACAADDLAAFVPVFTPVRNAMLATPVVASSPVGSPLTPLTDSSDTIKSSSSSAPKAISTRKRKLKDIDGDEDFNEIDNDEHLKVIAVKQDPKWRQASPPWEPVDKSYSRRKVSNEMQYRCDLCLEKIPAQLHVCRREGDMARHLQSLKHTAKSFFCSNPGCSSGYTREDALKRHMKTCLV